MDFLIAQKIVQRFLTEERIIKKPKPRVVEKMTKEELAKLLGIEPTELAVFNSPVDYAKIDSKVVLALNDLYCATAWEQGETRVK